MAVLAMLAIPAAKGQTEFYLAFQSCAKHHKSSANVWLTKTTTTTPKAASHMQQTIFNKRNCINFQSSEYILGSSLTIQTKTFRPVHYQNRDIVKQTAKEEIKHKITCPGSGQEWV